MLAVRKMHNSDLPRVLALLKICFPSATANAFWWHWKYRRNPAGEPLLLVAEKNTEIVGLRAFWPRLFIGEGEKHKLYQPTDTVVHPDERGQGIFRKMTSEAISQLQQQEQTTAVFNFPNNQSGPGYLKMGWEASALLRWRLKPLPTLKKKQVRPVSPDACLHSLADNLQSPDNSFLKDHAYIQWRYLEHPRKKYQFWPINDSGEEPVYAVTATITKKSVPTTLLVDLLGSAGSVGEGGGITRARLAQISSSLPSSLGKPLVILEASAKSCSQWTMRYQSFFRLPLFKANYYTRSINDESLRKKLAQAVIFPGDMDTF